jgi:hypothetical protein
MTMPLYLCSPVTGWPIYTPRHRISLFIGF